MTMGPSYGWRNSLRFVLKSHSILFRELQRPCLRMAVTSTSASEEDEKDRQKSRSHAVPVEDVDGAVDLENLSSLINNGNLQHLSKLAAWTVQEVLYNIVF